MILKSVNQVFEMMTQAIMLYSEPGHYSWYQSQSRTVLDSGLD